MKQARDKAQPELQQAIAQKQQLEQANQALEQRLQKAQRRVTELKQTVTHLEQENRSLQKKLKRLKDKQRQQEQPPQVKQGMKTLAGQLEAKSGDTKPSNRQATTAKTSPAATAPPITPDTDPYQIDGDRMMRAYFGDRQDFRKGARGR
ncbi:MAG: hypothetical protein AAFY20_25085 [Cyanobacteria bacterium J06639_14]